MISVIICSVNKSFALQVQQNISETIGVPWQAIIIDNTINPKGITSVYNEGAARAEYGILCFAHEDILFKTKDWGMILSGYFSADPELGLVGVAGCGYKSKTPSGWATGIKELDCCNITHYSAQGLEQKIYMNPAEGSTTQPAVVLDGVFLCCPKKVWQAVKFDEVLLTDFHLYDIDFSIRVARDHKAIVSFEIDIVHIVKGAHYGNRWLESTLLWHNSKKDILPTAIRGMSLPQPDLEKRILKAWLSRLKHERISLRNRLRWLADIGIWKNVQAWPFVFLFLTKNIFKGR